MVRMNNNYECSEIKIRLFNHSPNTIPPTDAKYSNGMDNKGHLRSSGVLVTVRFHFVLVDFGDKYEMMSIVNRYLVTWIIASIGWTSMWWNAGAPVKWRTKWNSAVPCILLWESVNRAVTMHHHAILSIWNSDTTICEWDSCFQVLLNH